MWFSNKNKASSPSPASSKSSSQSQPQPKPLAPAPTSTKAAAAQATLAAPRRSSRSSSSSSASASDKENHSQQRTPYTPVFQPKGYAYKIALPHAPKPGETPWPLHLPSVLTDPVGLQRSLSMPSSRPSLSSASPQSVARRHTNSMSGAAPPPPPKDAKYRGSSGGLNPLLAARALRWALELPPTHATTTTGAPLTHSHRAQPVAFPAPTSALILRSEHFSWTITVSSPTLGALLDALYSALQAPLTPGEWAAAGPEQARVAAAYRARCARAREGWAEYEARCGVRRIDVLAARGLAAFSGIAPTSEPAVFLVRLGAAIY